MAQIDDIRSELKDVRRQLRAMQRLDVLGVGSLAVYSGTPAAGDVAGWSGAGTIVDAGYGTAAVTRYSGTPTAGRYAYWTAAGTVADSGFGTADLPRYSGTPTAGQMAYWTAAGTVAGAGSAFWDNTNRRLGINNSSPASALDVVGVAIITNSASALQVNRTTSSTTALRALAGFLLNSSGSTADGCGPAFFFQLADAESPGGNTIGEIGAVRAGADDTGDLVLVATASGVAVEVCRALHGGQLAVGMTSVNANVLGIEAGTSNNDAAVGGVLYVDSGTNANGTTVETDLSTYTVPANTLAVNNQSLEFEAYITITNNANTKTIKLYFGTDTWTMPTTSGAASTLYVRGRIVRTGSATQDVFYTASLNNTAPTNVFSTATRTLSGTVALKFTGQSNSASNDVKQELFIVKWSDSNT